MKLQFTLTFLRGPEVVAQVVGIERRDSDFRVSDLTEKVIEVEQYLERLTGLRCHIEQVL